MFESTHRFYSAETKQRVTHTLNAGEIKKLLKSGETKPLYINVPDGQEKPEGYKDVNQGNLKVGDTQEVIPSHALITRDLSTERYFELACNDQGYQEMFESVSGLLKIYKNDMLYNWKMGQRDKYLIQCLKDMEVEQSVIDQLRTNMYHYRLPNDAAERGTAWHGATELWMQGRSDYLKSLSPVHYDAFYQFGTALHHALMEICGGKEYVVVDIEKSFCNPIGIAGTADLKLEASDDTHDGIVMDYKFTDNELEVAKRSKKPKRAYDSQALQLAMYALGLGMKRPRLINVYGNTETGELVYWEWPNPERWIKCALMATQFFYIYKVGGFPRTDWGEKFDVTIQAFLDDYFEYGEFDNA